MRRLPGLGNHRTLWIGLAAAALPLGAMLALQWVWLTRLANTTAIAHRSALRRFVEAVGVEVASFYRSQGEGCLVLPASILEGEGRAKVARHWAQRPTEGVKLFLVDYTAAPFGAYGMFDAERGAFETPPASDETLAIVVACSPWQVASYTGSTTEPLGLVTDERTPDHRLVLHPLVTENRLVVGVTGMILDPVHFRENVLPRIVAETSARHFADAEEHPFVVTVRDAAGEIAFSSAGAAGGKAARRGAGPDAENVAAALPFVFTDWTVELESLDRTPEELARASFAFHVTLTALLAVALLGGILLALRAADRAMRLSEMKSDFVSNVSHELRTPLASIRVFAELLRRGKADSAETVRKYGEHIEAETRRLSRLIDNILDFSRIESGAKEYRFAAASLEDVVASVVDTFRVRTGDAGFRIALETPQPRLPPVEMDADAIGQVLHNLLDNAVKYSGDARDIVITIEREPGLALCTVRDSGPGIPAAERERVFERFHRVGTGLVHDVKGSGLGLAIVRHVVEAHGGRVEVESEPGRGTAVRFRLPLNGGSDACPES
jgi:signal transduction histidine kinase